ncbi:XdhC family protein [bacterium]|nr:XdhC family protein [candidate division CSSED10-310 bacterium]
MHAGILEKIMEIQSGRAPHAVMVVVVATSDSTPQSPGARMLVMANGGTVGTVGGGAIEKLAVDHAGHMLVRSVNTDYKQFDMSGIELKSGSGKATGMVCGGTMSLYFERIAPPDRFIVYGCGHIGGILTPLASQCGFHVIVVDHRTDMTSRERFSEPVEIHCTLPPDHAGQFPMQPADSIVIMTHNHQFDAAVLGNLLKRVTTETMPRYIGMIGSARKVMITLEKLEKEGISKAILDRIHTPIGLKIGGGSPAEIAVSVMAEILAVKYAFLNTGCVVSMRSAATVLAES